MIEALVLYKILTLDDWDKCKLTDRLCTPANDSAFVHFATEKQYPAVVEKWFANMPHVVLRVDASKLVGKLVLEWVESHSDKYYHLYDGHVPLEAVIDRVK